MTQTYVLLLNKTVEPNKINEIITRHDFRKDKTQDNVYVWKGQEYTSIKGCYFCINNNFNLSSYTDEKVAYKMACMSSTPRGHSYDDLEKQINVLKDIQSIYGGQIYDPNENSWGIRENNLPKLSRTEIAWGMEYVDFKVDLNEEMHSIKEVDMNQVYFDSSIKKYTYPRALIDNHNIINQLITLVEKFFKSLFVKYLKTNQSAYNKFVSDYVDKDRTRKLAPQQKFNYHLRDYTFQNLNHIQTAYKKYINFDFKKVLDEKLMLQGQALTIEEIIKPILYTRHKKIHENIYDLKLNRAKTLQHCIAIETFISTFIEKVMESHNYNLLIEYELMY
ncbi:hypothetical protein LRO89_07840 [Priestia megaterium]|uniref:hypothetical protein n=1 Tax=Priestia megaterium TaxID=1404 RepID=UPI0039C1687E